MYKIYKIETYVYTLIFNMHETVHLFLFILQLLSNFLKRIKCKKKVC